MSHTGSSRHHVKFSVVLTLLLVFTLCVSPLMTRAQQEGASASSQGADVKSIPASTGTMPAPIITRPQYLGTEPQPTAEQLEVSEGMDRRIEAAWAARTE